LIKPKKSLGQNFLKDNNIIDKITKQIRIKNRTILEIGPGYGNLTDKIIKHNPKKLILLEKDLKLFSLLKKKYNSVKIDLYNIDALKFDYTLLKNVIIISNLPYNISSKIILKLIKLNKNIANIICMIQKELAQKFDYKTGKMNKYKFINQYCTDYKIFFNVSPNVFWPKPKVYSSLVGFKLKKKNFENIKIDMFIKTLFQHNRKKLRYKLKNINLKDFNNLKVLDKRIEELKFNELLKIYKFF